MPTDQTRPLTRQMLATVLRHGPPHAPTDRELLARFTAARDEEAFAELVRRHGRMVLAVGRRVTGHAQDAEDAFQAAFLVLARRAGHVARPELLGNWLHGVAYRTALEARAARARVKEQQPVADTPEPAAPTPADDPTDLRRVIDEELDRLPEKYRSAVVLCDLEGISRKDAAGRLRIPEGTLSSRLAHARKVLAARLSRRGVSASAATVAAALGSDAAAAVPAQLIRLTARAAARAPGGGVVPPDLVSTRVATLTDGVIKAMIVNRLRLTTGAVMLALGTLGLGTAAVIGQNPRPRAADPLAQPAGPGDPLADRPEKGKGKAKAPPKIAAKGVEDDDVPYPSVPVQAVVRFEDGKLLVRQRTRQYVQRVHTTPQGEWPYVVTEMRSGVSGKTYDVADVSVFDMKGSRVPEKVWKEQLKTDRFVLATFDGRLPHPRELQLFKDDTLMIVFPNYGYDIQPHAVRPAGVVQPSPGTPPAAPRPVPLFDTPPLPPDGKK